jgi:hypothetical protein
MVAAFGKTTGSYNTHHPKKSMQKQKPIRRKRLRQYLHTRRGLQRSEQKVRFIFMKVSSLLQQTLFVTVAYMNNTPSV